MQFIQVENRKCIEEKNMEKEKLKKIILIVVVIVLIIATALLRSCNSKKNEDVKRKETSTLEIESTPTPEATEQTEETLGGEAHNDVIATPAPKTTDTRTFAVKTDEYLSAVNQYLAIDNRYAQIADVSNYTNNVADYTELEDEDAKFHGLIYMEARTNPTQTFVNDYGVEMSSEYNLGVYCYGTIDDEYNITIHYLAIGNVSNTYAEGELLIDDGYVTQEMKKEIIVADIGWNVY